ncbi:LpqB family beta-propeller domain-containing protein [Cellulomonas carbonis]|uniref:Lipoprotein n=1 Tax=Cellulomonas carbonis T26 TaxID=947969 RepID=A0A0A0BNE8_9CELL|nr:LpqB family beta-propeller domain-containing protein [Cellulomonas carbonis]KGM09491.1 lipoprotein [Cellulomonas carbonis T26]GGC11594.1 lipoprotein LpqB [Cellulomonas carbonis]
MTARPRTRPDASPVRRRTRAAAVAVVALLALAGCVGIPTSGPIGTGEAVLTEPGSAIPLANDPEPDATPVELVNGFLRAVDAGLYDEFAVARKFLSRAASTEWDPRARVVVYQGRGPEITAEPDGAVVVSVPVAATVDSTGHFVEAGPSAREEVAFELRRDGAGQWRISQLDDGVLISAPTFEQLYRQTPVYFASADRTHLVPDVRWFPTRNQATSAVEALLAGPSEWLRDAVLTGAPEGARLTTASVPVTDGVARVDVSAQAQLAGAADRELLLAQLEATLGRLPGVLVDEVRLLIGGVEVETTGAATLVRDPGPADGPYVLSGGRLAVLEQGGLSPLEDAAAVPATANSPALGADGVPRVVRDGTDSLLLLPPEAGAPQAVAAGAGLVAPSVDRFDWVWTGERTPGASLLVVSPGGGEVRVAAEWLEGRTLQAIRVSRDGTRIAVVSSGVEGVALDVAAVVREEDGTPGLLGPAARLAPGLQEATDLAWVDEATLAVLGRTQAQSAATMHVVVVGGRSTALPLVDGAVGVAAGRGERALYVRTADGTLHLRQNQTWAVVAEDVQGVAFPG